MAKPKKPYNPAHAQERADREAEVSRLRRQGATVKRDRDGSILSAYRSNVFNLLLSRNTITQAHHDAACALAEDWAAWKGLDGGADKMAEFIDGGSGCPELITDRMVQAGRRVRATLDPIGEPSRAIIAAFMVATVEEDRPMAWRGVMERLGITGRDRQTQAVVASCEALREAREQPRREAA